MSDPAASRIGEDLERVRRAAPLVHNVTNLVAMSLSANVLIAAGASPIMSAAPEEAGELAATASALVVNMGTLTRDWVEGAMAAVAGANRARRPWVLDPVGVGATAFRDATAARLLAEKPRIVRGNASEIAALAGAGAGGKGVDSTLGADAAGEAALALAHRTGAVVVATGPVDFATDGGGRTCRVANGHPLLTAVTASGCALTALIGAWAAVVEDPLDAATGALAAYGVAAELAAEGAQGPGSFGAALLDRLASLDAATLAARARVG
jgi:hydroxyethylthiazole kinase